MHIIIETFIPLTSPHSSPNRTHFHIQPSSKSIRPMHNEIKNSHPHSQLRSPQVKNPFEPRVVEARNGGKIPEHGSSIEAMCAMHAQASRHARDASPSADRLVTCVADWSLRNRTAMDPASNT